MADFTLGQLVWKITGDNSAFNKSYQESIKKLERFGKASTRIGRSLTTKLTLPLIGLGTAAVVTAGKLETQRVAFGKLLQDTEKCFIKLGMKNIQPLTAGIAHSLLRNCFSK